MKILLLVDDYMPGSIKIAAVMMHDLAKELQVQGHQVMVCTPDISLSAAYSYDEYDGVEILRFKSGEIKNVSKFKRAINETLLSHKAWQALKHGFEDDQFDLIVYYSPTIFFGRLVSKLKSIWDCRTILILRDFFPQWAVDNGLIRSDSLIHRYFQYFEKINYKSADTIAVQSPSNKLYFENDDHLKHYQDKLDVLYNWIDGSIDMLSSEVGIKEKLGITDKLVFFYGGNIGHAQDMMNLMRLSKSLSSNPKAHILLVGKGDEVALIQDYVNTNNLTNVTYLSSVSQEEYNKILIDVDVGLFSLHRDHKTHNFPGKLLGYMKYSKPILGSINCGNDLQDVVESAGAGFVTVNGEDDRFTENAFKLLDSESLRLEMGANSNRLLSEVFSVKAAASKIVELCHV